MNNDNKLNNGNYDNSSKVIQDMSSSLNDMETLTQYLKSSAGSRQGRSIPPLENWHPEQVIDMDLVIKANGEWWHEGTHMTRESLVSLFATVLWKEEKEGLSEYFLKTPAQKLRIKVEDVPLLINDVGIVNEEGISWLEFTTTTGDVVRLDQHHQIELRPFIVTDKENAVTNDSLASNEQIRPYLLVRNGLEALIGRNTFYHLTEIGKLTEQQGVVILTLQSGGKDYQLSMPDEQ